MARAPPPLSSLPPPPRRPTVVLLLGLALAFCLAVLSIQSSFFTAPRLASRLDLDSDEVRALSGFQSRVQQCVARRGLGLTADIIDHCKLVLRFPKGTNSTWVSIPCHVHMQLLLLTDLCPSTKVHSRYHFS
jgi:hypothetical protein